MLIILFGSRSFAIEPDTMPLPKPERLPPVTMIHCILLSDTGRYKVEIYKVIECLEYLFIVKIRVYKWAIIYQFKKFNLKSFDLHKNVGIILDLIHTDLIHFVELLF